MLIYFSICYLLIQFALAPLSNLEKRNKLTTALWFFTFQKEKIKPLIFFSLLNTVFWPRPGTNEVFLFNSNILSASSDFSAEFSSFFLVFGASKSNDTLMDVFSISLSIGMTAFDAYSFESRRNRDRYCYASLFARE